jgi:hypothetical protein
LKEPFQALYRWTVEYLPQVAQARERFDQRLSEQEKAMSDAQA